MPLESVEAVLVKDLGGKKVWMEFSANANKADAIAVKADRQVGPTAAADVAIGVCMADVDITKETHGWVWIGPGEVWANCAAALSVGNPLSAGDNGQFALATEATDHISAVIFDDSYVDTNYVKILLLR